MTLSQSYLDEHDEPFGFMDFASIGAMSKRARRSAHEIVDVMAAADGKLLETLMGEVEAAGKAVADLVGTDPDHVAIVPNTSSPLFATAFGLPKGSVVVPASDFPANRYPWYRAGQEGRIEPRFVDARDGRYTPEVFAQAMDASTVAVAISHADYRTGYRIDVAGLREVAGEALVVVDAVQSLGALRSPMEDADVLVAGGQKWLRAGVGVAVLAMSDRAMERLAPTLTGWLGVDDPFGLDVPLPHAPIPTPARYTMGSPPITMMAGLRGAIEAVSLADPDAVEAAVIDRAQTVEEEVRRAGAELLSTWEDQSERSGIVSFRLPDEPSVETNARLVEAGFTLTERNGWLRAAPHASTDPDAPAALGEVLARR